MRPRFQATGLNLACLLLSAGFALLDRLCPPDLSRLAQLGTEFLARDGRALPVLAQVFALLPHAPPDLAPALASAVAAQASLRLLFPPPDATLSSDGPVPIRVMGGRRPVTFLVDGVALASSPASRSALWQPDGAGFHTLSAQDADGAVVRGELLLTSARQAYTVTARERHEVADIDQDSGG